jgi:tetratricopeptide (TPR) repeat protein
MDAGAPTSGAALGASTAVPELPARYALADDPILGEGGMGRVLRARDLVLEVPVAIKLVRPDLAADARFRRLFDLEVRISARFAHPNVVPIHDHGTASDGTPFLGLAYADAGSFAGFRDEPAEWPEILRLALELLDALAHLHARGVLHRDLKPENILLHHGEDGLRHVWLADLGLANASADLARKKGRSEGTPGFMSPEQAAGQPREYGPWTDLFSLGVVLWELVTGSRPFPDEWDSLPPLPPLEARIPVPSGLATLLGNLLCPEPLSRYDLAADLRAELLALGDATSTGLIAAVPGTVGPSSTTVLGRLGTVYGFDVSMLDASQGVPVWNRPQPPKLPESPPLTRGLGGRARASLQLFSLRELPLVARAEARQQLWSEARAVAAEGSRVVIIAGEAGSGKTSLIEAVVRDLEEGGWAEAVHLRYQVPSGPEDGYAGAARALVRPWNETADSLRERLVRQLTRERGARDQAVEEEASILVRWAGLGEEGGEPVAAGFGLREVYRHLGAREWRGLSCLVIDDAHWAIDEGDGLAIAEAVLQGGVEGQKRRLLVLVAVRTEELAQQPALAERVEQLVRAGASRLDLPRLDRDGTRALLAEALNLTPELADKVAAKCEGNPLFARQLLQEWAQRGSLVDTGNLVYGLAPDVDADAVLPADAATLLASRVAGLARASGQPDDFRDVAHLAALAGRSLPRGLLLDEIARGLSDFVRACGLWIEEDDSLRFDGTLLHQAVQTAAESRSDAVDLHRRLVGAWESFGERTGAPVDLQVGRHAASAAWWEKAIPALLAAADRAWSRGRVQELEAAARMAHDAARAAGDDRSAGRACLAWGRAFEGQGRPLDAEELFLRAAGLLDATDAAGAREARLGLGWSRREKGEIPEARRFYTEAIELARAAGDGRVEALGLLGQAWVEQQQRNFEGADLLFTRAENRLSRLQDARGAANAVLGSAGVARRRGEIDDAEERYLEVIEDFRALQDPLGLARAHIGRSEVLRLAGSLAEAEEELLSARGLAEELGATAIAMDARLGLADVARRGGEFDRARRLYEAHVAWAERQSAFEAGILGCLGAARLALAESDVAHAFSWAERAHQQLARAQGHWSWASYRLLVAQILARRSDEKATFQWLWSAQELGLGDIVDPDVADALAEIARVAREQRGGNTLRVAGKLAISQYDRLGRAEAAREIQAWVG